MALDKQSKTLLSAMLSEDGKHSLKVAVDPYWLTDSDLTARALAEKCKLTEESLNTNIEHLFKEGYVDFRIDEHNGKPFRDVFYLTHKGINFKEYERINLWEQFVQSIACPCLVALITTLITSNWANILSTLTSGLKTVCDFLGRMFG